VAVVQVLECCKQMFAARDTEERSTAFSTLLTIGTQRKGDLVELTTREHEDD
jgi:hypothetical protein